MSEGEMLRLACIYAESDQQEFLRCWTDDVSDEGKRVTRETKAFLKKVRAYRLKRWGKTQGEIILEQAKPVSIRELAKRGEKRE